MKKSTTTKSYPSPPESREGTPIDTLEDEIQIDNSDEDPPARKSLKRKATTSSKMPAKTVKRSTGSETLHGKKMKKTDQQVEIMTKVPTLKKLQAYKSFPSFRAEMDDHVNIEFKKQQAVFILADPETMDDPYKYPDQSDYWLGVITDIRAKSKIQKSHGMEEWVADPSDVFVVVKWFYKPHDIVETPGSISKSTVMQVQGDYEFMGMKELIASEEQAVISVFSCCDPVPIYHFNESATKDEPAISLMTDNEWRKGKDHEEPDDPEDFPNDFHAAQANYFYRMTLPPYKGAAKKGKKGATKKGTKASKAASDDEEESSNFGLPTHCVCEKPYSPSADTMRYCEGCAMWFHGECLKKRVTEDGEIEVDIGGDGEPAPLALVDQAKTPIIRGLEWGIGGNINLVLKAREALANGQFDDEVARLDEAGLGDWNEWLAMMQKIKPGDADENYGRQIETKYTCPQCDKTI